jgi:hypothetical protein
MARIQNLVYILICFCVVLMGEGQKIYRGYVTLGLSGGGMHYQGDLDDNGFDFWNVFVQGNTNNVGNPFRLIRPQVGVQSAFYFHPHLFFGLAFHQGWIGADDGNATFQERVIRNLHFRSPITEGAFWIGYHFRSRLNRELRFRPRVNPWIATGIALFHFNPQAKPDPEWVKRDQQLGGRFGFQTNQWVDLQPLGTEGQYLGLPDYPAPYKRTQLAIPIGGGIDFFLAPRWQLTLYAMVRKTFTDYLDDVSNFYYPDPILLLQSGNSKAVFFSDRSLYSDFGREFFLFLMGQISVSQLHTAYHVQQAQLQSQGEVTTFRGQPNQNDWYAVYGITLSYILIDPDKCPVFRFPKKKK